MLWHHDVEPAFRKLFDEQWRLSRHAPVPAPGRDEGARATGEASRRRDWLDEAFEDAAEAACCPVSWLMPDLMDLIARTAHEPLDIVRDEVRALLTEQDFNEMSGDTVSDHRRRELLDLYVDRLTRTIDRVRRRIPTVESSAVAADSSCFFG